MTDKEQQSGPGGAISTIIQVVEPLDESVREKVLSAVSAFFSFQTSSALQQKTEGGQGDFNIPPDSSSSAGIKDILTLKQQKKPKSDIEMAVVMAFYLSELAPSRQKTVSAQDVETYFKQAQYKLPKSPDQTLRNAKNAGYFDSAGTGQFKLNPVGYNLVAHSLPKIPSSNKSKVKRKKNTRIQKKKKIKK